MNELKPDMIYHGRCIWDCGNGGHHDTEMLAILAKGTKLYAIPDTRRVVSVELLGEMVKACEYAGWTIIAEELRAIIDNKEQS